MYAHVASTPCLGRLTTRAIEADAHAVAGHVAREGGGTTI
jgi:hypothetical protein